MHVCILADVWPWKGVNRKVHSGSSEEVSESVVHKWCLVLILLCSMRLIHLSRMCTMWVSEATPMDPAGFQCFLFGCFFPLFGPLIRHLRHKTMRNCKQVHVGSPQGVIPGGRVGDSSPHKERCSTYDGGCTLCTFISVKTLHREHFHLGSKLWDVWQRLATETLAPSCSLVTQVSFTVTITSGFCWRREHQPVYCHLVARRLNCNEPLRSHSRHARGRLMATIVCDLFKI